MAIRCDASADSFRGPGLASVSNFTMMGWFRITTSRYATLLKNGTSNSSTNSYMAVFDASGNFALSNNAAASNVTGSSVSVGTWYHVAITVAGTGAGQFLGYLNGVLNITHAGNASVPNQQVRIGSSGTGDGEFLNGRFAALKFYTAVLTAADIQREMWTYNPVRLTNLSDFYRCTRPVANDNAVADNSGGTTMTVGGVVTVEDGPPIRYGPSRKLIVPPLLAGNGFRDIATRFRLALQDYQDIDTRFHLAQQGWEDIPLRLNLSSSTTSDVPTRFVLFAQAGFPAVSAPFLLMASNAPASPAGVKRVMIRRS